jgi:hypothetical protein
VRCVIVICVVLLLSGSICHAQTPPADPIAPPSGHETLDQCMHEWGKPGVKDDCYCGAYPNEVGTRSFITVGNTKVLVVSFETDPVVNGPKNARGCWYLTPFTFPKGYSLVGYHFQTNTGGGPCTVWWDSLKPEPFTGFNAQPLNRRESQKIHQVNYQECQEFVDWPPNKPHPDLEFKFLLGGYPLKGYVPSTSLLGLGGMNTRDIEYSEYSFGSASIILYFVKQ